MGHTNEFAASSLIARQAAMPCEKLVVSKSETYTVSIYSSGWILVREWTRYEHLSSLSNGYAGPLTYLSINTRRL